MLELMFTHDALKWLLINTNSIDRANTAGTLLRAERRQDQFVLYLYVL